LWQYGVEGQKCSGEFEYNGAKVFWY